MPCEARIEALEEGWAWGAPLPGGEYRVVAFLGPSTLKKYGGKGPSFLALLADSMLFRPAADAARGPLLRACPATPHLDMDSWRPGYVKLGENALALDPLSSCGVERAMRLALQAVIAANTLLRDPQAAALARDFYESSLAESAAAHSVWSRGYYRQAWPGPDSAFWRDRSRPWVHGRAEGPPLLTRLREACTRHEGMATDNRPPDRRGIDPSVIPTEALSCILRSPVRLSPDVCILDAPCVVDDLVQLRRAVSHPALGRPLAFLAGQDLASLLQVTPAARSLGHLISIWSSRMPLMTATRIAGWLSQRGLLQTNTPG
jgi:hypothetical protein